MFLQSREWVTHLLIIYRSRNLDTTNNKQQQQTKSTNIDSCFTLCYRITQPRYYHKACRIQRLQCITYNNNAMYIKGRNMMFILKIALRCTKLLNILYYIVSWQQYEGMYKLLLFYCFLVIQLILMYVDIVSFLMICLKVENRPLQ